MKSHSTAIAATLFVCVLVAVGLFAGHFLIYMTSNIMILSIFAMGFNILLGRSGLLSFGHAAFYACGAYGLALTSMHLSSNPLVGIAAGILLAAVMSLVIGFFCVRHTEIYFAMLTLAFGMMVYSLIWNLRGITGGDDGLYGIMRTSVSLGLASIPIVKENQFYFLVLFFFLGALASIYRIYQSPFGLVLSGIRENHVRTEFAGFPVKRYRLAAFVISGCYAGLAGTLSTLLESGASPYTAHWTHSAEPVLVSLIGGMQTFAGPVVGSVIYVGLREVIERFTQNWMLWFGIILLVIIMGFRGGVAGSILQPFRRRSGEREEEVSYE